MMVTVTYHPICLCYDLNPCYIDEYSIKSLVSSGSSVEVETDALDLKPSLSSSQLMHHLWTRLTKPMRRRIQRDLTKFENIEDKGRPVAQITSYTVNVQEVLNLLRDTGNAITTNLVQAYMTLLVKSFSSASVSWDIAEVI